MKNMLNNALIAGAFVAIAAPASAAPISIVFGDDTRLENQVGGIDVFGAVEVSESGDVSLGAADGVNDIEIYDETSGGFAEIYPALSIPLEVFPEGGQFGPQYFTSISFAATSERGGLRGFNRGDDVASLGGDWTFGGFLYEDFTGGLLGGSNSSTLLGFRVEVFENSGLPEIDFEFCEINEFQADECNPGPGEQELLQTHYGWLELGRGSVVLQGGAFNTTAGGSILAGVAPADPMAPVPLPAAGWMLLAGIGGLAAVKRRKKA